MKGNEVFEVTLKSDTEKSKERAERERARDVIEKVGGLVSCFMIV